MNSLRNIARPANFGTHAAPRLLIVTLIGAASALAMAPFNWIVVLFITLPLLYALLDQAHSKWQAFLTGWFFGVGYHIAGLYWIANALLVEGNPYSWAWPLAAIGLPVALAIYLGLATLLAWRLSHLRTLSGFLIFVLALFGAEYLRGHLLTGFPWNLLGYGWGGVWPLVQIVQFTGIYGLTLLTILWCTLPGFMLLGTSSRTGKTILAATSVFVLCIGWGYGANQLNGDKKDDQNTEKANFVIVQPNIAQHNKWRESRLYENFQRHLKPSYYDESADIAPPETTFIVWPETALAYFHLRNRKFRSQIEDMLQSYPGDAYLISGALLRFREETVGKKRYANAIITMNENGRIMHRYKKSHLVPFGEYIPFQNLIPIQPIAEFNNLVAGDGPKLLRPNKDHMFLPLICYEVIFPEIAKAKSTQADWLVNVTNDAWYGHSTAPYQHFMQARFRAVENGKPLIRAANTGISGVIDSRGQIITRTEIFSAENFYLKLP